MGGLLIVKLLLQPDIESYVSGAVIQCPALQVHQESRPSALMENFARVLENWIPKIPLVSGNKGKNCSPSVSVRNEAAITADPLFYSGLLRIGTGLSMLRAIEGVQTSFHEIKTPYLLQHGTSDRVCHVDGSSQFHEKTTSVDKTFTRYDEAQHDLLHEPQEIVDQVVQDCKDWIVKRC